MRRFIAARASVGAALTHGAGNRHVVELEPALDASQHQPAAAHVATADELGGNRRRSPKIVSSTRRTFRRRCCPAARHRSPDRRVDERPRAALERPPIADLVEIDGLPGEGPQRLARDGLSAERKPAFGVITRMPPAPPDRRVRRPGEATRVGELAAKVEPAEEAEDLAEHRAFRRAQLLGERELRGIRQDPASRGVRLRLAGDSRKIRLPPRSRHGLVLCTFIYRGGAAHGPNRPVPVVRRPGRRGREVLHSVFKNSKITNVSRYTKAGHETHDGPPDR